jgi:hypothetical protein
LLLILIKPNLGANMMKISDFSKLLNEKWPLF